MGEFSNGLVRVGGHVFSEKSNDKSRDKSHDGTDPSAPGGSNGISGKSNKSFGKSKFRGNPQGRDKGYGGDDQLLFKDIGDFFESFTFGGGGGEQGG